MPGASVTPTRIIAPQRPGARPGPIRLTRRGRIVVGGAVVAAAVAACMVLLSLGGGALAASHGAGQAGYRGMRHLIVEPGQTLWSIAVTAEPDADPRVTIQQIMQSNSLGGSVVYAGERLWVPGR